MSLSPAALLLCLFASPAFPQAPPNVLLVIADDVGIYELASFGEGTDPAVTPTIDQLALDGVSFPNCYANPFCTPTRATIMTGRYSVDTGCGTLLSSSWGLQQGELTVAEAIGLSPGGYARGFFGKWHLTNADGGGELAPNLQGFDHASWTYDNLIPFHPPFSTYFHWEEVEDGTTVTHDGYVTSHTVDRALEWIASVPEPWFVVLSFHAAHHPMHKPPDGLYSESLVHVPLSNERPYYKAILEAMDAELGRFLETLGEARENTNVVFLGDNGSPISVIGPPGVPQKAKGSVYEGGINVPLIVTGPAVTAPGGSSSKALVNTTDLFATLVEMSGLTIPPHVEKNLKLNSISILPYLADPTVASKRKITYSDYFAPGGFSAASYQAGARDRRYKLIVRYPPITYEFYDLLLDPLEENDLFGTPLGAQAEVSFKALRAHVLAKMFDYFL